MRKLLKFTYWPQILAVLIVYCLLLLVLSLMTCPAGTITSDETERIELLENHLEEANLFIDSLVDAHNQLVRELEDCRNGEGGDE